jgi:hypothetical protein
MARVEGNKSVERGQHMGSHGRPPCIPQCTAHIGMIKGMADFEPAKDEQFATAHDYDRWLAADSLSARWARFWLAPKRTL